MLPHPDIYLSLRILCGLCLFCLSFSLPAQNDSDTGVVPEIIIRAYPKRSSFRQPSSVTTLNEAQLKRQPGYSLLPAMNSLPGVRMEERSPGSYRLSLRGSLLRSPFGIRNVKIYVDEFALTDAGGNTYLNLIDPGNLKKIEVMKGPEGSLFGANTGGVVLLSTSSLKSVEGSHVEGSISGGTYGLFQEKAAWRKRLEKYQAELYQSYQKSDGYRENSAMQRKYISLTQRLDYRKNRQLRSFLLYSDLQYETPGGLTLKQFQDNPAQARPKTSTLPGTSQQKAAVYNKTFFGGILHESILGKSLRHILAVSGMDTDFKNPFITNFEERDEASLSIRSYFELKGNETKNIRWKWNLGIEWQKTNSGISNYGNRNGVKDTIQSSDRIKARQYFWFSRFSADIRERLILEASLSLNNYQYRYLNNFPVAETAFRLKRFSPQLMPKLSTSFKISEGLLWRSSVSRGYSPPTIAEVRPSDNNLYADLKPEAGWNYESGLRAKTASERFYIDLTFFYYQLQNAIVRRVNSLGADYYVNAGGTQQSGAEVLSRLQLLPSRDGGLFRKLELRNSITLYHFKFSDYQNASADYSDHWLTGVPPLSVVSSISTEAGRHLYLFIQHTYTDRIPLNDDNSVYASSWHLLQAKAGWKFNLKIQAELFIGADNILNQRYSLGNDLNALGGRYYNAAPPRNFYAGMNMEF